MLTIRPAHERGHVQHGGWLESFHSFSFGAYYDARHLGVSNLRVINDDTVLPGGGFATHGHQDMEIVSYVLEGSLAHKDSLGNGSVIRPGDVQRMSAGTGVLHSEFNPSSEQPVHFLQIWLQPHRRGLTPSYAQRHFPASERRGQLRLLVSSDGRDGSLSAHQDALLYGALLEKGDVVRLPLAPGRIGYVHLARGALRVNGRPLRAGDGARIEAEAEVRLEGESDAEVLLFDLP